MISTELATKIARNRRNGSQTFALTGAELDELLDETDLGVQVAELTRPVPPELHVSTDEDPWEPSKGRAGIFPDAEYVRTHLSGSYPRVRHYFRDPHTGVRFVWPTSDGSGHQVPQSLIPTDAKAMNLATGTRAGLLDALKEDAVDAEARAG